MTEYDYGNNESQDAPQTQEGKNNKAFNVWFPVVFAFLTTPLALLYLNNTIGRFTEIFGLAVCYIFTYFLTPATLRTMHDYFHNLFLWFMLTLALLTLASLLFLSHATR